MAFTVAMTPTYKTEVTVHTPNDKGTWDKSVFWAVFKRHDVAELEEIRTLPQQEALQRVLVGWSELTDGDGRELTFNAANQAALLRIPQAQLALAESFWASIFKAREKN